MNITKISLENFRLFSEKTEFELSPLTVFTGPNNSGKSSVIKALLLLKENLKDSDFFEELLTEDGMHKLGELRTFITDNNEKENLTIELSTKIEGSNNYTVLFDLNKKFHSGFQLHIGKNLGKYVIIRVEKVKNHQQEISVFINYPQVLYSMKNENEWVENSLIFEYERSEVYCSPAFNEKLKIIEDKAFEKVSIEFVEHYKSYLNEQDLKKIADEEEILGGKEPFWETIFFGGKKEEKEYFTYNKDKYFSVIEDDLKNYIQEELEEEGLSEHIRIKKCRLDETKFYNYVQDAIRAYYKLIESLRKTSYLPSIRGNMERIYNKSDKHNYFYNTLNEFKKANIQESDSSEEWKFVNEFLRIFEIGDNLSIEVIKNQVLEVYVEKNGAKRLLADLGFGYTQLLPIILKIAIHAKNRTEDKEGNGVIIIEEPEANLHPMLQSRLAGLFGYAAKMFNIQFIIETHSEYLIRKFKNFVANLYIPIDNIRGGYEDVLLSKMDDESKLLVISVFSKFQITTEDVLIYYLGKNEFKKIRIDSNGALTDSFGSGFFDEADNLAIELFSINKDQRN